MKFWICILLFQLTFFYSKSQEPLPINQHSADSLSQQKDLVDLLAKIFSGKKADSTKNSAPKKKSKNTVLPAIGYNPSIGFLIGINFLRTFSKGDPLTTKLSVAQLDFSYTTKNLVIARFRTNIFTKNNKYNLQGNWQYMRNYVNDYGLSDSARRDPPVNYPIRFNYFRLFEKVYKNIGNNFYAGAGISFDVRNDIQDENYDSTRNTPHHQYSVDKGFNPDNYSANGFILAIQYNTKEHPNRPFGGMYADLNIRYNTKILGSTQESGQLYTEFRKYWSLSRKNPEHVIAVWYWGSYQLWGKMPYLEIPSTEYDTYNRSGRGYTLGRFRGPSFADFEMEYRFPISQRSKFFSGVVFSSIQAPSDANNEHLFGFVEPAAGIGLRVLFNKRTRTNLCLDYARGRYGSNGLFFALNEAF